MINLSRTLAIFCSVAAVIAAGPFWASPESEAAPLKSRMVAGEEAFQRVTALTTQIPWYTSLAHAEQVAQKQNKPIFWLHMLGPLNGKT